MTERRTAGPDARRRRARLLVRKIANEELVIRNVPELLSSPLTDSDALRAAIAWRGERAERALPELHRRAERPRAAQIHATAAERRAALAQLRQDGLSLAEIGEQFGISKQRVSQLLKRQAAP